VQLGDTLAASGWPLLEGARDRLDRFRPSRTAIPLPVFRTFGMVASVERDNQVPVATNEVDVSDRSAPGGRICSR
jgi:hypothetical protein